MPGTLQISRISGAERFTDRILIAKTPGDTIPIGDTAGTALAGTATLASGTRRGHRTTGYTAGVLAALPELALAVARTGAGAQAVRACLPLSTVGITAAALDTLAIGTAGRKGTAMRIFSANTVHRAGRQKKSAHAAKQ